MRPRAPRLIAAALLGVLLGSSQPGAASQHATTGRVSINKLRAGDCLTDLTPDEQVRKVDVVPCDRPHRAEVLDELALPRTPYAAEAIDRAGIDGCGQILRSIYPYAVDDSAARLMWLQPLAPAWNRGDRTLTCILVTHTPRTNSYPSQFAVARTRSHDRHTAGAHQIGPE